MLGRNTATRLPGRAVDMRAAVARLKLPQCQMRRFVANRPAHKHRLHTIVNAVPGLGPQSRVIDVGSGTGCLIQHMQAAGVRDILAVDLSSGMLTQLRKRYPDPGTLGNTPGVRIWHGDLVDLPAYQSPADAIYMNAVFGNFHSTREALLRAALLLRPGGCVVISHPMGRMWHKELRASDPAMVPHALPDRAAVEELVADLPLRVLQYTDEPELYLTVLQVPDGYKLQQAPLRLQGKVVTGFGRGSKQLGVPTANIDPVPIAQQLEPLPRGVYFGWAQLDAPPGGPAADGRVHKMVMNIGRRPTVNDGTDVTVECHIMHPYAADFYGRNLKVVVLGYIRPEIKFSGLDSLLGRIRADIGIARTQLDNPDLARYGSEEAFAGP